MKTFKQFNEAAIKVDRFRVISANNVTYGIVLTLDNTVQVTEKTGITLEDVKNLWSTNKEAFVPKDKNWLISLIS